MTSMLRSENPLLTIDMYKSGHEEQYNNNITQVYSNYIARKSRVEGIDHVVMFGLNNYLEHLNRRWSLFFEDGDYAKDCIVEYSKICREVLGRLVPYEHFHYLHEYGRLPLTIHSVPEGTIVPIRTPIFTIENTQGFARSLPQFIESDFSNRFWKSLTSATISVERRRKDNLAVEQSGGPKYLLPYLNHDFSYRGLSGSEDALMVGMGHLVGSDGSDTLPAIQRIKELYVGEHIGRSVPATEHSVMCVNGKDLEYETFDRLLDIYSDSIISVVSDTWNLWRVIDTILPRLGAKLTNRTLPIVIRPDSGDPIKILMGNSKEADPVARMGVIPYLMDKFGFRLTDKGYKLLPVFLGTIYGDAMSSERCDSLNKTMLSYGVCPTCAVRGIGSYTYEYVTRDTFGQALKATLCKDISNVETEIFKDPITDSGEKKSLVGRVGLMHDNNNVIIGHRDRLSVNDPTGFTYNPMVDGTLNLDTDFTMIRKRTKVW